MPAPLPGGGAGFPPTLPHKKAMPLVPPAPEGEGELDPELKAYLEDEEMWKTLQEKVIEPKRRSLWQYFVLSVGAVSWSSGVARTSKQLKLKDFSGKWQAGPDYARRYFDERGGQLIKDVTETDRKRIRALLIEHWGKGEVAFAREVANDVLLDSKRAKLIFRSEMHLTHEAGAYSMGHFNGAKFRVYISNGLNACPKCRAMNGEVRPIDQPFSDGSYFPHKHPMCECSQYMFTQTPTKEQLIDCNKRSKETKNEDFAALDKYVSITIRDKPELNKKGELMKIDLG